MIINRSSSNTSLPLLIATTLNGWVDGRTGTNGQTFQEIVHILLDFHLFTSSCPHALGQKAPQGPLLGSDILTFPTSSSFPLPCPHPIPAIPSLAVFSARSLTHSFPLIKGAQALLPYSCLAFNKQIVDRERKRGPTTPTHKQSWIAGANKQQEKVF